MTFANSLDQFNAELEQFAALLRDLNGRDLCDANQTTIKIWLAVRALANDIENFGRVFSQVYETALKESTRRHSDESNQLFCLLGKAVPNPLDGTLSLSEGETAQLRGLLSYDFKFEQSLGASYKAFYFFIRALQDAICRLLGLWLGEKYSKDISITKIAKLDEMKFKPLSKVGNFFNQAVPEYLRWFIKLKKKRDIMKLGNGYSIQTGFCPQTSTSQIIPKLSNVEPPHNSLSIDEVIESVRISRTLLAEVFSFGERKQLLRPMANIVPAPHLVASGRAKLIKL